MSDSRLFKILYYLLDKGHATAPELAAEFEVSVRTVYRDVDALSSAGIPVYAEAGRNGGIYLLKNFVLDKTLLSEKEREEILTAIQSMSVTGYASGKEMLAKLSAVFGMNTVNWLEVDFSRWGKQSRDNSKFELLKTAIIGHRAVKMVYEGSAGTGSERTVWPLKLSYKSKEWYLKAFCPDKQDFRLFKLNRILFPKLLDSSFIPLTYPEQQEKRQEEYPDIVLRFPKEMAYRVYDEFDETQIERQENGDFIAAAKMPVDAWLVGYLLSFGAQVEVMEPKELRKLLAEQAQEIYEKNKS